MDKEVVLEINKLVAGMGYRLPVEHQTPLIQHNGSQMGDRCTPDKCHKSSIKKRKKSSEESPFDRIIGCEQAKTDIIEAIGLPYIHKDLYTQYGQRPIKGILLSGPPGCGKTMLGKAAAEHVADLHGFNGWEQCFKYIKASDIFDKYVGESEKAVSALFAEAREFKDEYGVPLVIFIDEAEAILSSRKDSARYNVAVVCTFLAEMDGLKDNAAIVILATNTPEQLDSAVLREGRIDRKIEITRPTQQDVAKIAELSLNKIKLAEDESVSELASLVADRFFDKNMKVGTYGRFSQFINGAMVESCITMAVGMALRADIAAKSTKATGVGKQHLIDAVTRIYEQNLKFVG